MAFEKDMELVRVDIPGSLLFDEEWNASVEEEGGSVRKRRFEEDESETSIHVWRGPKEEIRKVNME